MRPASMALCGRRRVVGEKQLTPGVPPSDCVVVCCAFPPRPARHQVEKGTQGVDSRVVNPRSKGAKQQRPSSSQAAASFQEGWCRQFSMSLNCSCMVNCHTCVASCPAVLRADQRAFVITLTRAGEDDKSFKLTDIDSTFASFAGADYDLQVGRPAGVGARQQATGGRRVARAPSQHTPTLPVPKS